MVAMSDLLHSFDAFFYGEKPYNSGGAVGQQIGNESYRVIYTGSQREALREQLEAQLAKARSDALEEAAAICQKVAIDFGGYDPEGPSTLEAAHKCEGALACRAEVLAKEKP
jgi:hypothetical protein